MNKKLILNILGFTLLVFAILPKLNIPDINPKPNEPAINLEVEQPSDKIIKLVNPISKYILDKEDRKNIAVFNYVFSKRLTDYNVDCQQLNDIYVLAGEKFFDDSLKGKYENLSSDITNLFKLIIGDDNHILSTEEKSILKDYFSGLAWSLIQ